jgi:DNA-binding GntR family transcriptional regulator
MLVEPARNRGLRVVSLSPNELNDIFAIRVLLEVPSVAEIARAGLTPAQIEQLRHLAGATKRAADDGNLIEFLETDRQFHVGLIATLGNKPLADLVETLRDRVRLHGSRMVRPANISRSRPASIFSCSTRCQSRMRPALLR